MRAFHRVGPVLCLLLAMPLPAGDASAQAVKLQLGAMDMYGGVVLAKDLNAGVAFGGRLGVFALFGQRLRSGLELDWWTAERSAGDLEVRDIVGGLAVWRPWRRDRVVRPYVGLSLALHSVDVSRPDGSRLRPGESPEADRIDGSKLGASGFAGATVQLTRTGAIHLLLEYRYTLVSNIPHHEVRGGARLLAGGG